MSTSVLRILAVQHRTGLSRSGIYKLIGLGQFPKQIKLGKRASGWIEQEISNWINSRVSERNLDK